eukprot:Clim_evm9s4 gene=Clim_evmTU9s4
MAVLHLQSRPLKLRFSLKKSGRKAQIVKETEQVEPRTKGRLRSWRKELGLGKADSAGKRGRKDSSTVTSDKHGENIKVGSGVPQLSAITRALAEFLQPLHQKIMAKDHYGFFLEPVSEEDVPGYRDIIKKPMDLSTMEKKIKGMMYGTLEAYIDDLKLICDNCMTFNDDRSIYYREAKKLKGVAENMVEKSKKNWQAKEEQILESKGLRRTGEEKKDGEGEEEGEKPSDAMDVDQQQGHTEASSKTEGQAESDGTAAPAAVETQAVVEEEENTKIDLPRELIAEYIEYRGATETNKVQKSLRTLVEKHVYNVSVRDRAKAAVRPLKPANIGSLRGHRLFDTLAQHYDSTEATLGQEDSQLLRDLWHDESGVLYANSLLKMYDSTDSDKVSQRITARLDEITGGVFSQLAQAGIDEAEKEQNEKDEATGPEMLPRQISDPFLPDTEPLKEGQTEAPVEDRGEEPPAAPMAGLESDKQRVPAIEPVLKDTLIWLYENDLDVSFVTTDEGELAALYRQMKAAPDAFLDQNSTLIAALYLLQQERLNNGFNTSKTAGEPTPAEMHLACYLTRRLSIACYESKPQDLASVKALNGAIVEADPTPGLYESVVLSTPGRRDSQGHGNKAASSGPVHRPWKQGGSKFAPFPSKKPEVDIGPKPTCDHCGTSETPGWRIGANNDRLCSACNVYWRTKGSYPPLENR